MVVMTINTSFTNSVGRHASAVLALIAAAFMAIALDANADTEARDCTLRDVADWQLQLLDEREEVTPEYILTVTEAFLAACPYRPETAEAKKIAGMAAADMGDAERAILHFENASALYDDRAQFYYAAALLAAAQDAKAWNVRDSLINTWLNRLASNPDIAVEATDTRGGLIYKIKFLSPHPDTGIGVAWVAVPDGAGWPATLTIGSERQLTAIHRLRAGAEANTSQHVDYYRCRGRRLLARAEHDIPMSEMEEAARLTLIGYLSAPDADTETLSGEALPACLWPRRLLPRPAG